MYFRILGALEAGRCGAPITLGGPRQQTVLAMLLLHAEHVVPVFQLIDAVWQDDPPQTAREQIHICISSLWRAFGPADGVGLISTAGALVHCSARHRNERRLSVLEECIELELKAGLSVDPVSELMTLTGESPLRERFRALLVMVLCPAGRQALETCRDVRAHVSSRDVTHSLPAGRVGWAATVTASQVGVLAHHESERQRSACERSRSPALIRTGSANEYGGE